MDALYEIPPRLRLNRQATSFAATVDDSNFHNTFNYEREREASDEGDDDGSTPRLGREKISVDSFDEPLNFSAQAQAQSTPAPSAAERLRAVLSRASSLTPTVRTQNASSDRTPIANAAGLRDSDMESDFETPRPPANGVAATPYSNHSVTSSITQSTARESLRSIVAHALRSPGNSPERPRRPRRGSMDSSIVEESPIKWSVLKPGERPKRISLSDDEKERIKAARSGYADENSFESFTSSQAVIYDQLRQRLEGPRADIVRNNGKSLGKSDMTIDMEEATEVEEQLLQQREVPVKTKISEVPKTSNASAAQQSMSQFPSQFLGSNLLTENSDMQRMIGKAQTDTTDSEAPQSNRKDEKTPAAGASSDRPKSLVRPRAISRNGSVSSIGSSGSRPTSRQSMNNFENEDRKRERERGWNHPLGPYMERHRATSPLYSMTHSGGIGRLRNVSLGSISGSESDFGRSSPASTAKGQNDQQRNSKYAGIAPGRFPSSSSNQFRGSDRTRTVSQPTKPSSPGSLAGSAKSDRTQKPFDRSRTISLTTPGPSHPSSNHVHGRLPSKNSHNGSPGVEHSDRPVSPSSSRPSSRASSQLESPNGHERIHVRERKWNSTYPKRNAPVSPSLSSERKRTGSTARATTSPAQQRSRVTQATSSSPTSIPRPSVKGRAYHATQVDAGEGTEVNEREARNSFVLTALSANTLANVKRRSSSKDKDARQHALPKSDHKALSQYESEFGRVRPGSPTLSAEMNGTEESEEHDTPRIRQQHIPDSPTPGGSRPNSRAGLSLHSVKGENERGNGFMRTASIAEKERRQGGAEKGGTKRSAKASIPSEAIDLRESDLDSFQEEDIVASSSAPRLPNGSNLHDESDVASTDEGLYADIGVLRPGHDLRLNGREGAYGKTSALPAMVSPLLSPPPDPVTSTPQRRGSANTSKLEFRTPSPPRGMPTLPDPPLSEEDVASDKTPPTLVTPSNKTRNIDAKTPRFPGAWATPVGGFHSSALPRDNQAREKLVPLQDEAHGYPASYSRATSMIMKTPAPPGAWFATPGTIAAKRLQQKVRFDEREPSAAPSPVPTGDDGTLSSDFSVADGSVAMKAAGKVKPASPRTPGRIRVVDAFGNEIMSTKNGDQRRPIQKLEELHITGRNEKLTTSDGRKARIRVLDAMGREVDESQAHGLGAASISDESVKQSKPKEGESVAYSGQELVGRQLERKEALQLLRRTITELKDDFNETDDPASTRTTDDIDAQIANLKSQSIRAREDRERLLQKIKNVNAGNPPSRLSALWTALLRGKNAPGLSTHSTHVKVFITLIFLQVAMFFAFYWLTSLGARQLYFATYIDPFYPELYMRVINPDDLRLAMAANDYSETHVSTEPSWVGSILALLHGILGRLSIVKESIWDIWRDAPRSMPWPPT